VGSPGEDHAVEPTPCPFPARAWWGEQLVAETTSAIRVEEPGAPPALFFPCTDVRLDLFHDDERRTTCPVKGPARLWSIDPPVDGGAGSSAPSSAWGGPDVPDTSDGSDVLWSFTEPPFGLEWLSTPPPPT
jgi:acyl-CoA thioesterase II